VSFGALCVVFMLFNPTQSYRVSFAMWDHTVLPASQHQ